MNNIKKTRIENEKEGLSRVNNINSQNQERTQSTKELSDKLVEILEKSKELEEKGIPTQIISIRKTLERIKFEFQENALIPFWDEVENFVVQVSSYEESLRILEMNKKIYLKIINSTDNNFPTSFPSNIDTKFPEQIIIDFKQVQREAFKKFEFANLWEQRKTQKILAFGFSNLQSAINNMSDSVVSAINDLNNSVIDLNQTVFYGFNKLSNGIKTLELNNLQDMWLFRSDGATCFGQTVPL